MKSTLTWEVKPTTSSQELILESMEEPQTERHRERSREGFGVSRRPSWFNTAGETLSCLVSGLKGKSAGCFSASLS